MEITSKKIQSKIIELSQKISDFYLENNDFKYLSIVVPLSGGVPFAVDLVKSLSDEIQNKLLMCYAYDMDEEWYFSDSNPEIGEPILIIEDIYDTGKTLADIIPWLEENYSPREIKTVVLLDKKIQKINNITIDWTGFIVEDTWVFGYGMDDEHGMRRGIPYITD